MQLSNNVLAVLDSSSAADKALKRAVLIADRMDTELTILWTTAVDPSGTLKQMIVNLQADGMAINEEQLGKAKLVEAINELCEKTPFSVVVKSCDKKDKLSLLTPLDWQLLRNTPCPVLLVKKDSLWEGGKIFAAFNPFSRKRRYRELGQTLVNMAGMISRETRAELNLVVAYAAPMLAAEPENQTIELLEQKSKVKATELLEGLDLPEVHYQIGEGPADYWIPHIANKEQASLVVLGTHGRDGISGALLGNTAESVLDRIECDVLVVRETI